MESLRSQFSPPSLFMSKWERFRLMNISPARYFFYFPKVYYVWLIRLHMTVTTLCWFFTYMLMLCEWDAIPKVMYHKQYIDAFVLNSLLCMKYCWMWVLGVSIWLGLNLSKNLRGFLLFLHFRYHYHCARYFWFGCNFGNWCRGSTTYLPQSSLALKIYLGKVDIVWG